MLACSAADDCHTSSLQSTALDVTNILMVTTSSRAGTVPLMRLEDTVISHILQRRLRHRVASWFPSSQEQGPSQGSPSSHCILENSMNSFSLRHWLGMLEINETQDTANTTTANLVSCQE